MTTSSTYKTIKILEGKIKMYPKKRILFNPEESVDFQGNTGPFIQYTYARIQSILRKANEMDILWSSAVEPSFELHPKEKELLKQIQIFPYYSDLKVNYFLFNFL